ncbi:unnamed protein product [Nesidiocoris tenuis]|uniref:Uncharacterized protein n=1 Tax=Nesidiocoris tenuis TaxID=355587 RepID=A0A6H5G958_9HEMI|nr:unnamed protein product [Nesidiocoris tenuis]
MSTKRKAGPAGTSRMNFRPPTADSSSESSKVGTKPTADPSTVMGVMLSIFLYACRRMMFVNTFYRVLYYLAITFLISVIMDFAPASKIVMRKDGFFNTYFVKVGWGWTLLVSIPFVALTSFVHSCGQRDKVIRSACRLLIATVLWYVCTNFFNYVESIYGKCNIKNASLQSKAACLRKGHFWSSVDISGHTFILIYREEEYTRSLENSSLNTNPLRVLNERDFNFLTTSYQQFTPYIRLLFISMTGLTVIWEIMLWGTIIYYHSMLEKFLAALIAVTCWYVTYYIWFPMDILVSSPGEGSFKYNLTRTAGNAGIPPAASPWPKARKSYRRPSGPTFMGMPVMKTKEEDVQNSAKPPS